MKVSSVNRTGRQAGPTPAICPLCGEANQCVMAAPRPTGQTLLAGEPCWCTNENFSARLLAKLPARARGKACICAGCVAAHNDTATERSP